MPSVCSAYRHPARVESRLGFWFFAARRERQAWGLREGWGGCCYRAADLSRPGLLYPRVPVCSDTTGRVTCSVFRSLQSASITALISCMQVHPLNSLLNRKSFDFPRGSDGWHYWCRYHSDRACGSSSCLPAREVSLVSNDLLCSQH